MVAAVPDQPVGDDAELPERDAPLPTPEAELPRPDIKAVPDHARIFSKGSLVALAHGIEASLLDAEPDHADLPVVIALFQQEQYFSPERRRYRSIARNSIATLVGFVDEDPDVPSPITGVPLRAGEPLAREFCLVIISKCICVSLIGVESSRPATDERNRRFETRWSFDRARAVQEARRLLDELGERVPAALGDTIAQRLHDAEQAVPRRIEARLTAAFEQMVKRYQWVNGRVNELEEAQARTTDASGAAPIEAPPTDLDEVTQLGTRATLSRFFGDLMIDASMPRVAVAWLDVDDLDTINAQHGRDAGDTVLRIIANTIKAQVRDEDCFVRFGGDEFVLVMPSTDIGAAKRRALELVEAVSWNNLPDPYRDVQVSVSCGVAVGDLPAIELNRLRDTVNRGRGGNRGRTIVGDYLTTT